MSQKLPVNSLETMKDKNYNEESDEGYFLDIDI